MIKDLCYRCGKKIEISKKRYSKCGNLCFKCDREVSRIAKIKDNERKEQNRSKINV